MAGNQKDFCAICGAPAGKTHRVKCKYAGKVRKSSKS